jgi:hypothetical protein
MMTWVSAFRIGSMGVAVDATRYGGDKRDKIKDKHG